MATPPRSQPDTGWKAFGKQKWLTIVALPILSGSFLVGYYFPWGVLFIYWCVTSLKARRVFLVEEIDFDANPILFVAITAMWLGSGILYILADFAPNLLQ